MTRTRATAAQKRATRAASLADYKSMAYEATKVVLEVRRRQYRDGQKPSVIFVFPHWVRFEKSFPKGHIVKKTDLTNSHKINAVKLLDWLYSKGYSAYNTSMLLIETTALERVSKKIDRMFE